MSLRPAVAQGWAQARLRGAGITSPQAEARILLQHVTGLRPTELLVARELAPEVMARFEQVVEQRCSGMPLQHLTGEAWFRGIRLSVGPGVFIPRPETELVAGAAIEHAKALSAPVVVELCAGSGAISAAVANEVDDATVLAVEKHDEAYQWLGRNLTGTGVQLVHADMAGALPELDGRVDIVVANPPYVPLADRAALPADVREHDPDTALYAGPDGLGAIEVVAQVAARLLRGRGLVVIEHGDDQAAQSLALLATAGFTDLASHHDLAGRDRFVTGWLGERNVDP